MKKRMRVFRDGTTRRAGALALVATLVAALVIPSVGAASTKPLIGGPLNGMEVSVPVDAYEPDDTAETAWAIAVNGTPQARTVHAASDRDWVTFEARSGGTYVIEGGAPDIPNGVGEAGLPPVGNAAVLVELYDSDGRTLLASTVDGRRDAGSPTFQGPSAQRFDGNPRLVWTSNANKRVFVHVMPAYYYSIGNYVLSVRKEAPSITGRVTDSEGQPMNEIEIRAFGLGNGTVAQQESAVYYAQPDSEGNYAIIGAPPGTYRVEFSPWDDTYMSEYWDNQPDWADADLVTTSAGRTVRGIDAVIDEREPSIRGAVREPGGYAIPDMYVGLYYSSDGVNYWGYSGTYTDENGEYAFYELYEGYTYKVVFSDEWWTYDKYYSLQYWDNKDNLGEADPVALVSGAATHSVDATMNGAYAISGKVVDAGGEPLADVAVGFWPDGDYWSSYHTYTRADGTYYLYGPDQGTSGRLSFAEDSHQYKLEFYDDVSALEDGALLPVDYNAPLDGVDATLAAVPPVLTGRVTAGDTGEPLDGVEVWFYERWGDRWTPIDFEITDEDGRYALEGRFHSTVLVRFIDPYGSYASEYYNDVATEAEATAIHLSAPGGTGIIGAVLARKADRVAGNNRYSTAVQIAGQAFPSWSGLDTVIVASGEDRSAADPLAASGLSWLYDAPILLTGYSAMPTSTAAALADIVTENGSVTVHVVGGSSAVPEARMAELRSIAGTENVHRIAGANRYDTAAVIAETIDDQAIDEGKTMPSRVLVANGANTGGFFDVMALSPVSAATGAPVLLVRKDAVPTETSRALDALEPAEILVAGGQAAISNSVYISLGASERLSGRDRYATAASIADKAIDETWLLPFEVGIAANLTDAMTGGVLMGRREGVLLLTGRDTFPAASHSFLRDNRQDIRRCQVFGGPNAVTESVRDAVTHALTP